MTEVPRLSVIVPVLNDAASLAALLRELDPAAHAGQMEVLVVDGGSVDDSRRVAEQGGAQWLAAPPGRGHQLGAGVARSRGRWLWLLHADSSAIGGALHWLLRWSAEAPPGWGRFDVRLDRPSPLLRAVALLMNRRSRWTGICTGDQGMFVERQVLLSAGGIPAQRLMEDIELSRRLKRLARPQARPETITTSARRWRRDGVLVTVLSMWRFRLRYWFGADPEVLAREYYR